MLVPVLLVLLIVISLYLFYGCGGSGSLSCPNVASGGQTFGSNARCGGEVRPNASINGRVSKSFGSPIGRDIDNVNENNDQDDEVSFLSTNPDTGEAYAVSFDSLGRVYIVGCYEFAATPGSDDLIVIRFNSDGSIDNTFDNDGYLVLNSINQDFEWGVGLDCDIFPCDDSIFIIGGVNQIQDNYGLILPAQGSISRFFNQMPLSDSELVVLKMRMDGSIDNTFGQNGYFVFSNNSLNDVGNSIYVFSNRIYVGGEVSQNFQTDALILKLDYSGNLVDSVSFGKVNENDKGSSIFVDLQGRVYLVGFSGDELLVSRFIDGGSSLGFDSSFDGDGVVMLDGLAGSVGIEEAARIMTDNSDRIYVCGYGDRGNSREDMIVLRLRQDGSIDTNFAQSSIQPGVFVAGEFLGAGSDDRATSLAINSNGEIFVAGNSIGLQDQSIVLFKLNSQGQLDTSFGNNGYLIL
ncbi:MAG: hypothetical protein ABDH21_06990, partial [bacterium]